MHPVIGHHVGLCSRSLTKNMAAEVNNLYSPPVLQSRDSAWRIPPISYYL